MRSIFVVNRKETLKPAVVGILMIVLLVLVAGRFGRSPDEPDTDPTLPVWTETSEQELGESGGNYFAETRLSREKSRSQTVEILREIVNNPNSTSEARGVAQDRLIEMSEKLSMESESEQLLMGADYDEVLVYLMKDGALVLVKGEEIDEVQAAQIASVVSRVTGLSWERISIRTHP